jgi:RNA recognition motif-containing protein
VNEAEEDQRDKCTLFLGDLSLFCTEKDIEDAFVPFGKIVEVRIQRSKETARALSYGFIEFSESDFAEAALNSMNNYVLKGRPLRYANPSPCAETYMSSTLLNSPFANGVIIAELDGPQIATTR